MITGVDRLMNRLLGRRCLRRCLTLGLVVTRLFTS